MVFPPKLTIVVHDGLEILQSLRPEWDALLDEYPISTTFSTYEWLASWWRAFGSADRLLVLAFRDVSSQLVGLAPLAITTRSGFPFPMRVLRMMGDGSHDSDNLDLPVKPGFEDIARDALLGWLEQNASQWDVCELNTLPEASFLGSRILNAVQTRNWKVVTSRRPRTIVELAETWEEYLKRISSKERGKIGIRSRRLEKKYEIRIHRCTEEAEIAPLLQALFELHRKHWQMRGLPGTLHAPARRQFYAELAPLLLARRRLEFWVLEANRNIVAAQFGLRHGTTVFSLQEGFDPDYSSDSVGYVLRSHVLKTIIEEGARRYDFLGGTDESKMRWGGELKQYANVHFARPLSRGTVYLNWIEKRAQTKNWLRAHLPEQMWKGLKGTVKKTT